MKGKKSFTRDEIDALRMLIRQRVNAEASKQKGLRAKMRRIGFYGSDFGLSDLQPTDFERLLSSRQITISDGDGARIQPTQVHRKSIAVASSPAASAGKVVSSGKFVKFDPCTGSADDIPDSPGNYLICLRKGKQLPDVGVPFECTTYQELEVIYTGIAGTSLRKRDYRQHFTGNNAGSSTLRKSLGSLFRFPKIARDHNTNNGKTKFTPEDEARLTEWMHENLILYFTLHEDPDRLEDLLIQTYNPPLNLSKNRHPVNAEFRLKLKELRRNK